MNSQELVSEDHILQCIDRFFPSAGRDILLGRGDDCTVFETSDPVCVSTDFFIEDVHFRRNYFSPEDIGWKALAVNLSDLAAMGAKPLGFTLGLALPPNADMLLLEGLFQGMAQLADQVSTKFDHQFFLLGGDLSQAEKLTLCLTVFGRTKRPLRRAVAKPGDQLFLIGQIGLARTGLYVFEEFADDPSVRLSETEATQAHLRPIPRLIEGCSLSDLALNQEKELGRPVRLGLMDLSDGLARDLPRLLGKFGADLCLPQPHPEISAFLQRKNLLDPNEAFRQAYLGGEDYALIGTCERDITSTVQKILPETVLIGTVRSDEEVLFHGQNVAEIFGTGFDHFAGK